MMYSKRHLPDVDQQSQSIGSNVIPRRARPGLADVLTHARTVAEMAFDKQSSLIRGGEAQREREFFIDNLLVRIHLIIVMISVDRPCAMGV
jgi:hypothetical protein